MTANDLASASGGSCSPFALVFARGTTEQGNLGGTVGPKLQKDLEAAMPGQWLYQGVTYDASVEGDIELGGPGGKAAAQIIDAGAASWYVFSAF